MKGFVKNKIFYALLCFVAASLCAFAGISLGGKSARAENVNTTTGIVFEQGASARIDTEGDSSGLRFTAKIGKDVYDAVTQKGENGVSIKSNAELGMIIVPQSYIDAYDQKNRGRDYFTFFAENGISKASISTQFKAGQIFTLNGEYYVRGALVSIYPQNYTRVFRAIAYYAIDGEYFYALNDDGRSVEQVAVSAIQKEDERPEGYYQDNELSVLYTYADGLLPRVVYDAKKETHVTKLEQVDLTNATSVKTNVAIVGDKGNQWFEYTVTEAAASPNVLAFHYSLDLVDLTHYDHVYFKVKINRAGPACALCLDNNFSSVTETEWAPLGANEEMEVYLPIEDFIYGAKNNCSLVVKDLQAGDKLYISSFVAYGGKSVSYMIDGLPQEGFVSIAQRNEICDTATHYSDLSSGENGYSLVTNRNKLEVSKTLPLAVYEAGVDDDKFNQVAEDFVTLSKTVTHEEVNGDTAFKFSGTPLVLDGMYAWVYTYTLTGNEKDLDIYDFINFKAWTNGGAGVFAVGTVVDGKAQSVFTQDITAEPTDIALKKDDFLNGANGQLMIAFLSASEDAIFYMSDVIAMGATSLNGMIDRLAQQKDNDMTAPDQVSLADINNFVSILETTTDKTISKSSEQNLLRTEGRPYSVVNTTTEGATGRFIPIALENDGNGWAAEITQVREAGLNWFKITVTQKGKNGVLAYKLNTAAEDIDMNLSGYKMIALKFRVDGLSGLLSGGNGMGITIATEGVDTDQNEGTKNLAWSTDGMLQITPLISYTEIATSPNELFTMFDSGYLVLSGLGVGESIYISDFVCYNLYTAMTMIENLPYVSSIQESDYNEVKKVRAYLDQLSQGSNKTFAEIAAMADFAEESEKIETAFYAGYINALSNKFEMIENYFAEQNIIPILPAGDPTAGEAFVSVPVQADGVVGWSGTTESVTMDGEDWVEMSIEEIGTNQTLYFKLNLLDYITDTESIDYVTFTIKCTNPNATFSMSVGETDGMISSSAGVDFGEEESVVLGEDGYTFKVGFAELALLSIVVKYVDVSYTYKVTGLNVGDKVYVSSVKAYQKTYTQTIVDELPLASTISGAEILEYKEQIDLVREEVNGSSNKSSLNLTNLKALEFKLFEYYLGLLPTVTMDTAIDISSRSVEDIEYLKNIRKYYLGFKESSSSSTIYTNLQNNGYTADQATAAGDKWLNNEVVIFQVLLHAIEQENGLTKDNVHLVEDAMSCYIELKGHKTKGSTMQWVQNPNGGFLNGTFVSVPAQYADGKLTDEQKNLVKDLYRQALQAYVNALPTAAEITTLDKEAAILATREWLLARKDLASDNGCDYATANRLLGERENALLQLYIDKMDPSTVTRDSETDVAKVRAYYTLLVDTYELYVDVDSTKLLASEAVLLREKLAIMPTVDELTLNDLKAVERLYLTAANLMNAEGSLEVIDLTIEAAQLFIQVVQLQLDSIPSPEQLDGNSLIKYQGIQALVEEVYLLVPNPEWVLDMSHAMPSFLAATYLNTLMSLEAEPDMDSFSDASDTKEALQAFLDMVAYDESLANRVETDILYKNVMALLKYYWRNLPTFDVTSEDYQNYDLIGTGYYTNMQNARWLYDLMKSYGFDPDSLVDISVLLNYEKLLLKNYIGTLPEAAADVKMVNADSIQNVRVLFDRLQAAGVDVSALWTNEQMQEYELALELAQLFDLPDATAVTIEHQAQIENARALYDQLKKEGTDVSAYEEQLKACEVALLGAKIANVDTINCTKEEIQALRDEYQAKLNAKYDVSSIADKLETLENEWIAMSFVQSIFYEAVGRDSMQPIVEAYKYMQGLIDLGVTIPDDVKNEVSMYAFVTLRLQIENLPEAEEVTLADGEKIKGAVTLREMLTEAGIPLEEMLEEEYQVKLAACVEALNSLAA